MSLWEKLRTKILEASWWKVVTLNWDNRHLRKKNKELQKELEKLTLALEEYTNE